MEAESRTGDSVAFVRALLDGDQSALNELIGRNRWLLDALYCELEPCELQSPPWTPMDLSDKIKTSPLSFVLRSCIESAQPRLLLTSIRTLLTAGADPNSVDTAGRTPLFEACAGRPKWHREGACDEPVRLLLEHGANPNPKPVHGVTPLLYSCAFGFPELVGQLLAAGADPDVRGLYGTTLLCVCQRADPEASTKITRLLLQHRADPAVRLENGQVRALERSMLTPQSVSQHPIPNAETRRYTPPRKQKYLQ